MLMPDLHAAIRERLDMRPTFGVTALAAGQVAPNAARWINAAHAAIEAVLDRHKPDQRGDCSECLESGPGYEAECVQAPCPTVKDIAERLGIET